MYDRILQNFGRLENFLQESGIPDKVDHSQLPMQNKMKLDMNAFKFLRKVFIRLQKESSSLPRQFHSNCHCSYKLHLEREYLCPQSFP